MSSSASKDTTRWSDAGGTPVIAVTGATASGKSGLSLVLAERFNGEIVNTDSMQVYRYFDIGTAKPTTEERRRVRHHLIDMIEPDEAYSAARYVQDAQKAIADIAGRGRLPILCGGTGLYFKALLFGLMDVPEIPQSIRAELEQRMAIAGTAVLHAELAQVDPETAAAVHPNDPVRVVRALEVYQATGSTLSDLRRRQPFRTRPVQPQGGAVLALGLSMRRPQLYQRINERVSSMLAAGWVDEVSGLLARGFGAGLKPMRAIGYREIASHLGGEEVAHPPGPTGDSLLSALENSIATSTRHYAKRQITWFNKHPEVFWRPAKERDGFVEDVARFLNEGRFPKSPGQPELP